MHKKQGHMHKTHEINTSHAHFMGFMHGVACGRHRGACISTRDGAVVCASEKRQYVHETHETSTQGAHFMNFMHGRGGGRWSDSRSTRVSA
jgi:hypothetical protein